MTSAAQTPGAFTAEDGTIAVIVLAHNEEDRIATCLASLPRGTEGIAIHVVVNGSSDSTAQIARNQAGVTVHEYVEGGKARSWNRIMLDTPGVDADAYVFVDGDAQLLPGSVVALARTLRETGANGAAGLPVNGRKAATYRREILEGDGLFGDLYALSGSFVARLRASGIRMPEDLIGDDSLIGALAKTDLGPDANWRDERVAPCAGAEFLCEPIRLRPSDLKAQAGRLRNYSLRHFQNRIITSLMQGDGPTALPRQMASLYPEYLPRFRPRLDPLAWWFDRQALRTMHQRMDRASAA
ncbi:glycosyltransferase [Parerythrobacter jejuensis]|uniref:Glycosyltransferase n=1 Tax=Parerythrobacter jejuensis TaxID=795812 RepID=A0A845AXZ5_9SPHN|nr:glycosyltransferase [Parerythrobacter jejuensis]MXP31387.1 glycosyltransferase [Parerythrobacter jejuensis]MXP34147.1 glycosyltransferase [Parerythrobacter jejuensis]